MKKFLILIHILAFLLIVNFSYAQIFDRDLLNLSRINPDFSRAYFKISLKEMWQFLDNANPSLSSVVIGTIDSGVEKSHPEFFTGVNFGNTPPELFLDTDSEGHGTGVAGIISANNLSSFITLPPDSRQMNGIVSGVKNLNSILEVRKKGNLDLVFLLAKVNDLVKSGASVINMSFGFNNPLPTAFFEETFRANLNSALFVVAVNEVGFNTVFATPDNLGLLSNVLTVAATDLNDNRAQFSVGSSGFGREVSLSAPGIEVYMPTILIQDGVRKATTDGIHQGIYNSRGEGTSFSAPIVTGVAAILKAIKPTLTPSEIKNILIKSADPIQTGEPNKRLGTGCYSNPNDSINTGCRLNALKAVQEMIF